MMLWDRLDEFLARIEKYVVVFMLSLMILLAFSQIILRNFFATGLSWGDSVVRYLVLWVGFIGATLATKENRHITIDVFSHWFSKRGNNYLDAVSYFCSMAICGLLTYAAVKFILFEIQMGSTTFFGLPLWLPELIIPVTFGLMTFRFTLRFVKILIKTLNRSLYPENNNQS
jgi:TRAP-type C4-dicarboxylate transport system permease small subunit